MGKMLKHVRKHVCEININNNVKFDCVFLIVPGLMRDRILGIQFLKQTSSKIDKEKNNILLKTEVNLSLIHI